LMRSYELYTEVFDYTGLDDPTLYRDGGATRDLLMTLGRSSSSTHQRLVEKQEKDKALDLLKHLCVHYPEYFQARLSLAQAYEQDGDTAAAIEQLREYKSIIDQFRERNQENLYYLAWQGQADYELGKRLTDTTVLQSGLDQVWRAFRAKPNDILTFRRLSVVLAEQERYEELGEAGELIARYKRFAEDPFVQRAISISQALKGR